MIKLEPDEKLILVVRKHSFVFLVYTVVFIFFAILPLVAFFVATSILPFSAGNYLSLFIFLYNLWLLIIWMLYFVQWTDYYLDVWYITDKKIYDVLQKGFFRRQVSILRFDRIQDITVEISGIIRTLLDFGKIHVQTAGETSVDFTLKDAKNPNKVREVISDLHNKALQNQNRSL